MKNTPKPQSKPEGVQVDLEDRLDTPGIVQFPLPKAQAKAQQKVAPNSTNSAQESIPKFAQDLKRDFESEENRPRDKEDKTNPQDSGSGQGHNGPEPSSGKALPKRKRPSSAYTKPPENDSSAETECPGVYVDMDDSGESPNAEAQQSQDWVEKIVQSLDAYYDQPRKEYVIQTPPLAGKNYQPHTEAQFKRDLRFLGVASKPTDGQLLSPADLVIKRIQETKYVKYVGALSGKQCGFYSENGIRLLVTSEPQIIEPEPGDFSNIDGVITNLLAGEQEPYASEQSHSFYGWLQRAYCALRDRKFAPGQALALAGPVEIGKSLLQNLITKILGGRCAKPALFLQGRTDFNGEMFEAEHLMLEDEAASTSHAARMALGTSIKNITANRTHPCHPKHRPIVNLAPWWRLSISVNDRPERLLILPPLVEDVADKIILLRATGFTMPMPTTTAEEQEIFWDTLVGELPAFLSWLVNKYVVPAEWRNRRFGVRAFHHPILLSELEELSPAIALLGLVDTAHIWELQSAVWEGTALQLRSLLLTNHKTARDADRLLGWTNACGQYLGDLAKIRPHRVKKTVKVGNIQHFEIWAETSV